MKMLNVDIETYSDNDLKHGVYKYVDTPNFEVLIFAYSIDGGPVESIDLSFEDLPEELEFALSDPKVTKVAFNAQFERVCLSKHLGLAELLDPSQWRCTMVHANEMGLPGSLDKCASYLNVTEQKDKSGTALINYFSKPCKPTKANGMRTRNLPEHDPEKWEKFMEYCEQDVRTEMAIADYLAEFPIPESEWCLYAIDQQIHDYGVGVDLALAEGAVTIDSKLREDILSQLKHVTGLDNPNSLKQFKDWLVNKGHPFPTLGKEIVKAYIEEGLVKGEVKEALELRLQLSNASTKKYDMMLNAVCSDNRLHGLLQFYGANRTGRWAGRLLQVQNLPRNYMNLLDEARDLVIEKDLEGLELVFGNVPDVLKQLIRTGLIAKAGHTFQVSDFSAIEARVIAWYADEKWVLDAFRSHGKIYEATADNMFHLGGVDKVSKEMRQRGKVATLALGYQGGTGALVAMGALNMGIPEEELQDLVDKWRNANKQIVQFWYDTQAKAIKALETGKLVKGPKGLKFYKKDMFLFVELPSGRRLSYANARLEEGKFGSKIVYEGQGSKVYFEKQDTYGGKLVENIVQATARDLLGEALVRLDASRYKIVFHVHDEVVAEVPEDGQNIEEMNRLMSITPVWAKGLPLSAEGYETKYYKKD